MENNIVSEQIYFSRFADRIPATVLITIHTRPGLVSVTICTWLLRGDKWSLCPLETRESYDEALRYIPLGAEQVLDVPPDYAMSAWLVRRPGETKKI